MSRNVGASVRARLKNRSDATREDYNLLLTRYGLERLLYRLSVSAHASNFLLKGALLFLLWHELPHRPTRDADLLGFGDADVDSVVAVFRDVCAVVRPQRRLVEIYAKADAWLRLDADAMGELAAVAGLPSEQDSEPEEARRFDLLLLNLQLALLRKEPGFVRMRDQVREIAGLLEEKSAIPMVREQLPLIHDVQDESWWQDVTVSMLEVLRLRLRLLVRLIDKRERKTLYTDFEDALGTETVVELPGVFSDNDLTRFRQKARHFLRAHQDHLTIHKLRTNKALTVADLAELERMLAESGIGNADELKQAKQEAQGLGLFVRMLVGMDREAAKQALGGFLEGKTLNASQIEFLNLIVNHLTEHGVMEAALLYESPFVDLAPQGPDSLFTSAQVDELVAMLARIRATAMAA